MSTPTARIFFVRHGETDWNAEGRLQGQQDIPLNRIGRLQAQESGERLKALMPAFAGLDHVSSPMRRTRETMELMRESMGLNRQGYRLDPRLVELTFGAWEGLTWKDVRKLDPVEAARRERDKWGFVPRTARATRCWQRVSGPSSKRSHATRWSSPTEALRAHFWLSPVVFPIATRPGSTSGRARCSSSRRRRIAGLDPRAFSGAVGLARRRTRPDTARER